MGKIAPGAIHRILHQIQILYFKDRDQISMIHSEVYLQIMC